jgi:protoheme IX farnesyltransferase
MTGPTAFAATRTAVRQRVADWVMLTKPRVVLMVLITTFVGFYLGASGGIDVARLAHTLLATALAASGTMALNQWMERDRDRRMRRTRSRPLPDGRLAPAEAFALGAVLLVSGLAYLAVAVGTLATALTGLIAASYLGLYTPLKGVTSLCSVVGAVPGALPPVAGWAASAGELGVAPWVLFAIMFLWQIPHTLAIGALYREDYAEAGIRVLPVIDWSGERTGTHAIVNCLALLPVALMPTLVGLAGGVYFAAALVLGMAFLVPAVTLKRAGTPAAARRLLLVSLIYLPALLAVMAFDKGPLVP